MQDRPSTKKDVRFIVAWTRLHIASECDHGVDIWCDPDPMSTIIKTDSVFLESFFVTPDEELSSSSSTFGHQAPLPPFPPPLPPLWPAPDRTRMIDRKLTISVNVVTLASIAAARGVDGVFGRFAAVWARL
ncbi:hypothetical protein EDD15DRAFT_2173975 [Pisolithus albus]|nr:hypothetical protein EDD15DRAFT_2173975 [Pisolithus albus]